MGKISGTLTEESKIYIIDEASNILESAEVHPVGNYSVDLLAQSSKFVMSVRTSDKKSLSFANVIPEVTTAPMKWATDTAGSEMSFSQGDTYTKRMFGESLWASAFSSLPLPSSGKYYIEFDQFNGPTKVFGVTSSRWSLPNGDNGNPIVLGTVCGHYTRYSSRAYGIDTTTELSGGLVAGATYGMIINRDGNYIKFSRDNIWEAVNTPIPINTVTLYLFCAVYNIDSFMRVNCGQHTFRYTPPNGFTAGVYV